jgi:2-methylcitrate synthase
MDAIRTAVSFIGMEDPEAADVSEPAQRRKAMRLFAKIPTCIARRPPRGQGPGARRARPGHSFAETFFHLVQGRCRSRRW